MSKFELVTFEKPVKVNEWVEPIDQLIAAVDTDPEHAAFKLTFEAKEEGKEMRAIRSAAKARGKTVRILHRDDSAVERVGQKESGRPIYKGDVIVTITVRDKYADGRGRKSKEEKAATTEEGVSRKG